MLLVSQSPTLYPHIFQVKIYKLILSTCSFGFIFSNKQFFRWLSVIMNITQLSTDSNFQIFFGDGVTIVLTAIQFGFQLLLLITYPFYIYVHKINYTRDQMVVLFSGSNIILKVFRHHCLQQPTIFMK